jgi:hypothetical protein
MLIVEKHIRISEKLSFCHSAKEYYRFRRKSPYNPVHMAGSPLFGFKRFYSTKKKGFQNNDIHHYLLFWEMFAHCAVFL